MSGLRLTLLGILAGLLAACGARPPSLAEQAAAEAAQRPVDFARLGWLRALEGDGAAAAAAFAQAEGPLADLGRARLAQDRLDPAGVLRHAAVAASAADGRVARIARRWVDRAAQALPDGSAQAAAALGAAAERRLAVGGAEASTLRVSFLPWLDLPRLRASPPRILDDGHLEALGKTWALTPGAGRPDPQGIVLSRFALPAAARELVLEVAGPALVWRGGALVCASPEDGFPPRRLRCAIGGEGPLIVAWASRRAPTLTAWTLPPIPEPGHDWIARALAAELALLDGDAAAAEAALGGAPETAGFAGLQARLAGMLPARPAHRRRDAARAAWRAHRPLAPLQADAALAALALEGGDAVAAEALLRAVLAEAPAAPEIWRQLARSLHQQSRRAAAAEALQAALNHAPDPCALLPDRITQGEDGPGFARLAADALACGRPVEAARHLLDQQRPAEALAALDGPPKAKGEPARAQRIRALLGLGRLADARALRAAGPGPEDLLGALDLSPPPGGDPFAGLEALIARHPHAGLSLDWILARPELAEFAPLLLDTEAAIAAYEAAADAPALQGGPAVRVLDHAILRFSANGKRLRWVHEVLAVRSRDAAETFGEIGLPAGARVAALYTRKADGRLRFGDEIMEKESVTLPELAPGDYVVAQYLEPADNGYLYDRGYLAPRVFFQGVDLPIFHQRFEVLAPDATPPEVQRLAGAPAPTPLRLGERAGWRFEAREVPLRAAEPEAPPAARWLPSARVGRGVQLADDLDYLRDRALGRRRKTAAFRAWAQAKAGEGPPAARIRRLARAVREAVDDSKGLIDEDVAWAVAQGSGNRALTLSAALEVVGVPHRLWLARPPGSVPAGPFLQVADFPYPLIFWAGGVLDPGPDRAAPGFSPAPLVGGDGVQVWPVDAPATPAPLPAPRTVGDTRRITVEARWGADGILTGAVVDRLEGQEAIVIGLYLSRLDAEQRPRLVERLLVSAVGAARVVSLEDPTAQDPDGPLTLRYRFEARVGDRLSLALFPVAPGRSHAALAQRSLPLQITLPTDQQITWRLEAARPLLLEGATAGTLEHVAGGHRFRRRLELRGRHLEAHSAVIVAGGEIPPEDYPAFAAWARQVDEAERLRLTQPEP